ncbi:MAG: FecR domain-containing protein [Pirellulales bacterium]|nr:FecR domain-containing protein [Pirellulales bacterium]
MSSRRDVSPEMQALIDAMLNGTISAEGVRQLELALDGNFAVQHFFREYCQLHINLDAETRAQRVIDGFIDRGDRSAVAMLLTAGGASLAEDQLQAARSAIGRRRANWLVAAGGLVAAVVAIVALVTPSTSPDGSTVTSADLSLEPLARVQIGVGETRYIPLSDFGYAMLEGPADLELLAPMRARLRNGRMKVRITAEKGHGFVVETPHGEVTDLGTEFGVDASSRSHSGIVVFEGAVDLSIPQANGARGAARIERLVQGEGLTFNRRGRLSRIMSIVTGGVATFEQGGDMRVQRISPVIVDVADNIAEPSLRMFYEIVPGGLNEDVLAYVDRSGHEWNGVDERGMPSYLRGADYVKPFNGDKMRPDMEISVTLGRPAYLFILLDHRVSPPDWLRKEFRDTGDEFGLDTAECLIGGKLCCTGHPRGVGPGQSVEERFSIWTREVRMPGVVKLGPNSAATYDAGMYGIAATAMDASLSTSTSIGAASDPLTEGD